MSGLKPCPKCGSDKLRPYVCGGRAAYGCWESAALEVECDCGLLFEAQVRISEEEENLPDDEIRHLTEERGIAMWNERTERTCRDIAKRDEAFKCSECGCRVTGGYVDNAYIVSGDWNHCPNCGAKVVE